MPPALLDERAVNERENAKYGGGSKLSRPTPGARTMQSDLFAAPILSGLLQAPAFVTPDEERTLIAAIDGVELTPFQFHGWTGRRLTASFGWHYDFQDASFRPAMPIPGWLEPVRWVLRVALVLVNWYTLIAQFWYGPLEPPLLLIMQNDRSGWYGNRYYVMLPSDYLRLGQPVPESAFIWWQIVQLFFGFMAVLLTLLLLTGHLFA